MSNDYLRWPLKYFQTHPPPEHYDEYKLQEVKRFCDEGRWTTAYLDAGAIYNGQKRKLAHLYIALIRYDNNNARQAQQETI